MDESRTKITLMVPVDTLVHSLSDVFGQNPEVDPEEVLARLFVAYYETRPLETKGLELLKSVTDKTKLALKESQERHNHYHGYVRRK